MENNIKKFDRVGGWLIFFCLGLISSIYSFLKSIIEEYKADVPDYFNIDNITNGLIGLLSLYLLIAIYKYRKKFAIKFAIIYCITRILINLSVTIYNFTIVGAPTDSFKVVSITTFLFSTILPIVWIFYFLRSERVRLTLVN